MHGREEKSTGSREGEKNKLNARQLPHQEINPATTQEKKAACSGLSIR